MATYNGARKKTTVGNRNAKSQSSETTGKNRNYVQNNGGGNGWGNTGRRTTRSTSDDGWGDTGRRPSGYTSGDLWGPLPSQGAAAESAWGKKSAWKNQKSSANQGKKPVPLVGANFSWDYDDYPALDSRPPVENVWEKRKEKLEGLKAMEPTNMTEEELMIQKAIELSKREAREEEERRRLIEEEYKLQNQMLAENPEFFSDFLTPDELPKTNNSFEPGTTDYQCNGSKNNNNERQSIWDCQEPVENQWNQKQSQKSGKKKKRNKSQTSAHTEDEISQNAWSDSRKFDQDKQNETVLPEQNDFQKTQGNWSQNPLDQNYSNETEEYESQRENDSAQLVKTTFLEAENESKLRKGSQPKISKVIDMFGGWGSKIPQNSSLKSSFKQESVECHDDFSSSHVPNNEEMHQEGNWGKAEKINQGDNWGKAEEIKQEDRWGKAEEINQEDKWGKADEINQEDKWRRAEEIYHEDNWGETEEICQDDNWRKAEQDENLKFSKNSSKHSEIENFSTYQNGQSSLNEEDAWNHNYPSSDMQYNNESKHSLYNHVKSSIDASPNEKNTTLNDDSWNCNYSSSDTKYNNELKNSLYSHIESNIAASATSSFCYGATDSSASLSKRSVPKDDMMNSIVQDYASLAVKCADVPAKENVPIPRKSEDIFNTAATLLNEDIPKPNLSNFEHSSVGVPQNLSMPAVSQTSKNEISYSLNNAAPTEVSSHFPNENIAGSLKDSNIGFPLNPESNGIDSFFSPRVNEPVQDVLNDLGEFPGDPSIPAPIHREIPIPCHPNPVMGNIMNPNLMMGINPLMMQQMMMLNNPFFLQQLHQMQMYYAAMSNPFNTPLITPMPLPPLNPMLNNTIGNISNGEPNSNMNPVPERNVDSNPTTHPPCYNVESEMERSLPPKSDSSKTPVAPNVEFESSWLSELLSEGAAHMDTFIPPPTMPVMDPPQNPHPAPNVENKVDMNIAQDPLRSTYQNETIRENSNCDMKNFKPENSTTKYGKTEDINANTRNVNSSNTPKSTVEASGWGDFDDKPKKNYSSWNEDVDGWADEKVTSSKSMINSSQYAPRKPTADRQPFRQPRQTSRW